MVRLSPADIPKDKKDCPTCHEEIGQSKCADTTGIKMNICCGQIIGESCLKAYLPHPREFVRHPCPLCGTKLDTSFIGTLYTVPNPPPFVPDLIDLWWFPWEETLPPLVPVAPVWDVTKDTPNNGSIWFASDAETEEFNKLVGTEVLGFTST